jgi:hypothetical protein
VYCPIGCRSVRHVLSLIRTRWYTFFLATFQHSQDSHTFLSCPCSFVRFFLSPQLHFCAPASPLPHHMIMGAHIRWLLISVIFGANLCPASALPKQYEISNKPRRIKVQGHRGGLGMRSEESLYAFAHAMVRPNTCLIHIEVLMNILGNWG